MLSFIFRLLNTLRASPRRRIHDLEGDLIYEPENIFTALDAASIMPQPPPPARTIRTRSTASQVFEMGTITSGTESSRDYATPPGTGSLPFMTEPGSPPPYTYSEGTSTNADEVEELPTYGQATSSDLDGRPMTEDEQATCMTCFNDRTPASCTWRYLLRLKASS